jgi:hypothetical protein
LICAIILLSHLALLSFTSATMSISPDFIIACAYLVIVPPILVIRQIKYDKEAAERKKKFDEDMAAIIESNDTDLAIKQKIESQNKKISSQNKKLSLLLQSMKQEREERRQKGEQREQRLSLAVSRMESRLQRPDQVL